MPMPDTLEGQIARYADRIAYLNHDIDDAIRAGLLTDADLPDATVDVLGRQAVLWSRDNDTYVLVANRGTAGLGRVARYMQRATE